MVTVINPSSIKEGDVEKINPDLTKFDVAKQQVSLVVDGLKKYELIATKEQQDEAMIILKQAAEVDKAIEEKRKALVAPWNDGAKKINNYVKDLIKDLSPMIPKIKAACLSFQRVQEEKAKEEKRKARIQQLVDMGFNYYERESAFKNGEVVINKINLEADDQFWNVLINNTSDRLVKQAEEAVKKLTEQNELTDIFGSDEDKVMVEEKINTLSNIPRPSATVVFTPAPSKLNGAAKVWKFEVTDASLVPREYLIVDETLIRKAVGAGSRQIPGVRIYQEDQLRIR